MPRISIRTKLLVGLALSIIIATSIVAAAANVFVIPAFERAEKQEVGKAVTGAVNVLNLSISRLESATEDWAFWDDTYRFIQDKNAEYVQSNIVPGAFKSLDINVMLFLDTAGDVVYSKAYDFATDEEMPTPTFSEGLLKNLSMLANQGGKSGIIVLPEGPMIFSVQPVLKSTREGPPAGALIMGRFVDQDLADMISRTVLLPVSVVPYGAYNLPEDFAAAKEMLKESNATAVSVNADYANGFAEIPDAFGSPALMLRVTVERNYYKLSVTALSHSIASAVLAIASAVVIVYILIERSLMRRIFALRNELIGIGESKDFTRRVTVNGDDEIGDLARSANWMLDSLENASGELKRYAEGLEDLVREQAERLKEKERMAAIGETATMVGHDLRNPLQAISNITYLIREEAASLPPEKREALMKWANKLDANVAYMDKIVSDLQDFARPLKIEKKDVKLKWLIEDALNSLKIPPNIRVEVDISPDAENIKNDPIILRRILINLMNNAVQAMPEGGALTVTASAAGGWLVLKVKDTGVGMDEETLKKIFTPLFTTKAKGMGLGLAVCDRLVSALGGNIEVQSSKGGGSTFTVRLPL